MKSFKCRDDNMQVIILSRDDIIDIEKIMDQAYIKYYENAPKDPKVDEFFIIELPDSELFKNNVVKYEPAFGDFEWEFDSDFKDDSDAIKFFKKIEKKFNDDFHLTIETIKEKHEYTGVRIGHNWT